MSASKIILGYTLALKGDVDAAAMEPTFVAPSNFKDPVKIEENKAAQKQSWYDNIGRRLYTAEFAEVHLIDVNSAVELHFKRGEWADSNLFASQRKKKEEPLSVALQVRQFLLHMHTDAWTDDIFAKKPGEGPDAVFVGFRIKGFLKVLGIECALQGNPLPLSMWYGSSDHRDVENALISDDATSKGVDLVTALTFFEDAGVFHKAGEEKPVVDVPDNYEPCVDAKLDATMSLLLGTRLGLVAERDTSTLLALRTVEKPKTKKKRKAPEPVAAQ